MEAILLLEKEHKECPHKGLQHCRGDWKILGEMESKRPIF
jgi:hypothetical protein